MMPVLVWGAPALPEHAATTRGWNLMKVRNRRLTSAMIAAATVLTIAMLAVPAAIGASKFSLRFVTQPQDSEINTTIRAGDLNQEAAFVQVELIDGMGRRVTNTKVTVT